MRISICLDKWDTFIPRISSWGIYNIAKSTTKKKDWHQVSALKDLQAPLLGKRLTLAPVPNRSARAPFWQEPDLSNVIWQTGLGLWSGQAWLRRKHILPLWLEEEKLSGIFWGQFIFPHVNNI